MRLQQLYISNFRGLKGDENVIDFSNSDIIFLIGQNNAGKSSFLRAYEFFVGSSKKAEIEDFYNYNTDLPIIIEGWFLKDAEDNKEEDLAGKGKAADPEWINKWVDAETNIIRVRKTWTSSGCIANKETFSPAKNEWVQNGFGGMDSLFTKYSPKPIPISAMEDQNSLEEQVNKLIQDDFIKKVRLDHSDKFNALVEGVKELQSLITNSEAVEQMNAELNENFQKVFAELTLKIQPSKDENIKLEDAFKKNHSISVQRQTNERKETFLQNGHGVIRQALFNFLSFLKKDNNTNRKQYLILFEEPELFLHPKIAFKLRDSLYKLVENSPYQILCATHSPLMIDISKPHSSLIRVTKDCEENTKTHQVGEAVFGKDSDMKEWVQMVNRFNPHICEAFYADKVLLVEGDTEAIVYRDILARLFPEQEIFVLNTGSKTNIPFFQLILTSFEIEHYIIHDTDSRKTSTNTNNPAWTINASIWKLLETANGKRPGICRRYVHEKNFEEAHGILLSGNKDKPLKAYQFAQTINKDSNVPCLNWLKDILGPKAILHDNEYVESRIPE